MSNKRVKINYVSEETGLQQRYGLWRISATKDNKQN